MNWQYNNCARFFAMTKLEYNNTKHVNTSYKLFKFNCKYYLHVFFGNKINSCFKSCSAKKLGKKLKKLDVYLFRNLVLCSKTINKSL